LALPVTSTPAPTVASAGKAKKMMPSLLVTSRLPPTETSPGMPQGTRSSRASLGLFRKMKLPSIAKSAENSRTLRMGLDATMMSPPTVPSIGRSKAGSNGFKNSSKLPTKLSLGKFTELICSLICTRRKLPTLSSRGKSTKKSCAFNVTESSRPTESRRGRPMEWRLGFSSSKRSRPTETSKGKTRNGAAPTSGASKALSKMATSRSTELSRGQSKVDSCAFEMAIKSRPTESRRGRPTEWGLGFSLSKRLRPTEASNGKAREGAAPTIGANKALSKIMTLRSTDLSRGQPKVESFAFEAAIKSRPTESRRGRPTEWRLGFC